jgi:hypothetical protein
MKNKTKATQVFRGGEYFGILVEHPTAEQWTNEFAKLARARWGDEYTDMVIDIGRPDNPIHEEAFEPYLPPSIPHLFHLGKLTREMIQAGIDNGKIHPKMTLQECEDLSQNGNQLHQ